MRATRSAAKSVIVAFSLLCAGWFVMNSAAPASNVDSPYYGGDPGAMHYSTLTQIDAQSASRLKEVWR